MLVSVGLDSKVVVWSGHNFEKLKTLAVHQSHVKGITFDPANKFFATASDDRTIKIFRFTSPGPTATQHDMVNNFVLETTISTPFKSSPLTTYFRRCSWSPDGNHIAAANAVNGPVSSVAIIERTRWDSEINLIGHEGPTEVCMFSPRLFYTKPPAANGTSNGQGSGNLVTVIASAGQDRTLSVWNTNTSRPVVILQDIASKSISDLSWSPDGQTLFACSLDGGIISVRFEGNDLGYVATAEENDKALQKYGGGRKGMGVAEDVDGLALENHSKAGELRGAESRMGALMGDDPTSHGESVPAANGASTNGDAEKSVDSSKEKEKEREKDKENEKEKEKEKEKENEKEKEKEREKEKEKEESADKTAERIKELKSRVTITKDGKKRVAPLLISSSGTGTSSLPQTQLIGSKTVAARDDTPQSILDLSKPFEGLPPGGIASMLLGNKRKAITADDEDEDDHAAKRPAGHLPILNNGVDGLEPATLQPSAHGVVPTPEFLRPAVMSSALNVSQVRLAVPKIRSHILRPMAKGALQGQSTAEEASRVPENIVFEARNPTSIRDPSHVTCSKRGTLLWQDFLPRAVILVTGNKDFWAAACEDGTLYVWTPAGRRIISSMLLEAQPVVLECRGHWLLCITANGLGYVWNVKTMASPHPPVSLGPILDLATTSLNQHSATPGPAISSAHLNSTGHIVVTLSNGDGFYYAREMYTWHRLSESWWAVGSQYWNSNDSSVSALQSTAVGPITKAKGKKDDSVDVSSGIIPYLERHTTTEVLLKGRAYALQRIIKSVLSKDGFESFESSVSIAHLENRIAGALLMGSKEEFRLYLFMYAKRIGAEGLRGKVEELLNGLLGGILRDKEVDKAHDGGVGQPFGWFSEGDEICGLDRKELLKGVVLILGKFSLVFEVRSWRLADDPYSTGKFRELQRLTVQYARVLDLTVDGAGDNEVENDGDAMAVEAT